MSLQKLSSMHTPCIKAPCPHFTAHASGKCPDHRSYRCVRCKKVSIATIKADSRGYCGGCTRAVNKFMGMKWS